jgi:hypothetical protein
MKGAWLLVKLEVGERERERERESSVVGGCVEVPYQSIYLLCLICCSAGSQVKDLDLFWPTGLV